MLDVYELLFEGEIMWLCSNALEHVSCPAQLMEWNLKSNNIYFSNIYVKITINIIVCKVWCESLSLGVFYYFNFNDKIQYWLYLMRFLELASLAQISATYRKVYF